MVLPSATTASPGPAATRDPPLAIFVMRASSGWMCRQMRRLTVARTRFAASQTRSAAPETPFSRQSSSVPATGASPTARRSSPNVRAAMSPSAAVEGETLGPTGRATAAISTRGQSKPPAPRYSNPLIPCQRLGTSLFIGAPSRCLLPARCTHPHPLSRHPTLSSLSIATRQSDPSILRCLLCRGDDLYRDKESGECRICPKAGERIAVMAAVAIPCSVLLIGSLVLLLHPVGGRFPAMLRPRRFLAWLAVNAKYIGIMVSVSPLRKCIAIGPLLSYLHHPFTHAELSSPLLCAAQAQDRLLLLRHCYQPGCELILPSAQVLCGFG